MDNELLLYQGRASVLMIAVVLIAGVGGDIRLLCLLGSKMLMVSLQPQILALGCRVIVVRCAVTDQETDFWIEGAHVQNSP